MKNVMDMPLEVSLLSSVQHLALPTFTRKLLLRALLYELYCLFQIVCPFCLIGFCWLSGFVGNNNIC